MSALKERVHTHLNTVSSDGQFTAILTKFEKMKCPRYVVAVFVDACQQAS